jgi:hypothetical protein
MLPERSLVHLKTFVREVLDSLKACSRGCEYTGNLSIDRLPQNISSLDILYDTVVWELVPKTRNVWTAKTPPSSKILRDKRIFVLFSKWIDL